MAVHLTRIYTKTGDDGTANLGDMSRVSKTDPRVEAYADVNEANAALGVALALGGLDGQAAALRRAVPNGPGAGGARARRAARRRPALLRQVQNALSDVGADLCTPVVPDPQWPAIRVTPDYTA